MDLAKIALQESILRWIDFHMNHLKELQTWSVNIDNNYVDIEMSMRNYGLILQDELQIMGHLPLTTHTDEIPNPLTISSTATSKTGQWTHSERVKTITLARPIEAKETNNKTEFKFE